MHSLSSNRKLCICIWGRTQTPTKLRQNLTECERYKEKEDGNGRERGREWEREGDEKRERERGREWEREREGEEEREKVGVNGRERGSVCERTIRPAKLGKLM